MDLVLIALGMLGFGAIAIAAYVFTVAARNYVSSDQFTNRQTGAPSNSKEDDDAKRDSRDRRGDQPVEFPITVDDITVVKDRRQRSGRREGADKSARQ